MAGLLSLFLLQACAASTPASNWSKVLMSEAATSKSRAVCVSYLSFFMQSHRYDAF